MRLLRVLKEVKTEAAMPHHVTDPSNIYILKILRLFERMDKQTQAYVFKKIMQQLDHSELLERDELFVQRENIKLKYFIFKTGVVIMVTSVFFVLFLGNLETSFLTEIFKTINIAISVKGD